jgi:uncharacterized membrane protein
MTIFAIIAFIITIVFVLRLTDRVDRLEIRIKQLTSENPNSGTTPPVVASVSPTFAPPVHTLETPPPIPQAVPISAPAPVTSPVTATPKPEHNEFKLGSQWFTGAGIVAVLLGVGFFFRYAVVNGLISEPVRIALGVLLGLVLIGGGLYLTKKYRAYGLSLVGTGLGALYLSFYSAYALYALVSAGVGFALLAVVIAAGIVLALTLNARQLATAALFGGYVGILLYSDAVSLTSAFISLFVLTVTAAVLNYSKTWSEQLALALVCTTLSLSWWISEHTISVQTILPLITALYVIFAIASVFMSLRDSGRYRLFGTFSTYAIPAAFFLICTLVLKSNEHQAITALGIAVFYGALGALVHVYARQRTELQRFVPVALLVAPAFLTLAIGLYFTGNVQIMALAIDAALMVIAGLQFRVRTQYILGQAVLILNGAWAVMYLLLNDSNPTDFSLPYLSSLTITTLVVALTAGAAWFAHSRFTGAFPEESVRAARAIDALGMYVAFMLLMINEITRAHLNADNGVLFVLIFGSVLSTLMFLLGHYGKEKVLRVATYVLYFVYAGVLLFGVVSGDNTVFIFNFYMLALIAECILGGVLYYVFQKEPETLGSEPVTMKKVIIIVSNILILAVLTDEITTYFRIHPVTVSTQYLERLIVSIFWLLYGIGALSVGISRRSTSARYIGVTLLIIAGLKIFLYDTLQLSDLYRFLSFFALGVILLIAGFFYYRSRQQTAVSVEHTTT